MSVGLYGQTMECTFASLSIDSVCMFTSLSIDSVCKRTKIPATPLDDNWEANQKNQRTLE